MVKSQNIQDIVISHYKNGEKFQKWQHYWQIKFIEVQLIVGYIVTNNLVQFVLNQNQEHQELTVQKEKCIYVVKKKT